MIRRLLDVIILELLNYFPAIVLLGPRQVGKTTLVKILQTQFIRQSVYLDLELPSQRARLDIDPEFYLANRQDQTVILDEVQEWPNLFPLVRGLIDQHRVAGRFYY